MGTVQASGGTGVYAAGDEKSIEIRISKPPSVDVRHTNNARELWAGITAQDNERTTGCAVRQVRHYSVCSVRALANGQRLTSNRSPRAVSSSK